MKHHCLACRAACHSPILLGLLGVWVAFVAATVIYGLTA